jgi:hypothetical protein
LVTTEFNTATGVSASYNCVRGGLSGTGNINADPLFVANDTLYHLSNSSPCIGAGISSASVGGVTLNAPLFDYSNTPRPRAAGTKPDIGAVENDLPTSIGAVKEIAGIPTSFGLEQNYPNPFNPATTIRYALPSKSNVKLVIYNMLGQAVSEPVNEEQSAGWKEVQWNARLRSANFGGQATNVASGIYFYRLQAGNFVETKKMLMLK